MPLLIPRQRPGYAALLLLAVCLLTVTLGACDATDTAVPAVLASSTLDRGPAFSAFPTAALLEMAEAEALLADTAALRTSNGDTLVFVPLVFDNAGLLHSPESFKELLIALEASTTFPTNPDVYFTDLGTFDSVLATTGNAASGRSHVDLYAQGRVV